MGALSKVLRLIECNGTHFNFECSILLSMLRWYMHQGLKKVFKAPLNDLNFISILSLHSMHFWAKWCTLSFTTALAFLQYYWTLHHALTPDSCRQFSSLVPKLTQHLQSQTPTRQNVKSLPSLLDHPHRSHLLAAGEPMDFEIGTSFQQLGDPRQPRGMMTGCFSTAQCREASDGIGRGKG